MESGADCFTTRNTRFEVLIKIAHEAMVHRLSMEALATICFLHPILLISIKVSTVSNYFCVCNQNNCRLQ